MTSQTDDRTIILDQVPEDGARPPSRTSWNGTWAAVGAGAVAFLAVLLAFATFRGGDAPADETATAKRLAAADRYEAAVAISARAFPDSAPVVYLISRDASAGALAAFSLSDGPVLVVPRCGDLPDVVGAEIRRLGPAEVIAIGSESSVCDDLVRQAIGG